jgi:apolipoprotein N-acyltransferase
VPRLRLAGAFPAQLVLASLSGALLFLANPPAGIGRLAFVALIPLFAVLSRAGSFRGALLGLVFGFTYYALVMYWVLLFGELAWGGLAFVNACYAALFGLLATVVFRPHRPLMSAAGIAALWTSIEFVHGMWPLGGLTWGDVAYTQSANHWLLPLASITGVWGVSFVVVLVNLLLLEAVRQGRGAARDAVLPVAAGILVAVAPALIPLAAPNASQVDVAMLQVAVPKGIVSSPHGSAREIAENFAGLHRTLAPSPPDLVVWPEDALDADPARDPALGDLVSESIREVGAPTLAGGITGPPGGRQYNQGVLFDAQGLAIDRYSKVHLVPFGEYVPWRGHLDFLGLLDQIPRDLTPGGSLPTLNLGAMPFADVICFENSFPSISRTLVDRGAQFIVVSTNNASYMSTAASRQHLIMSQFRAVENGRWIAHAAISGISAFIGPDGDVHEPTRLFQETITRSDIQASTHRTLYTRLGDFLPVACLFLAGGMLVAPKRRKRSTTIPASLEPGVRALAILPTYNEAATIREVISKLLALDEPIDILVVDDCSPDGTADIVEEVSHDDTRVSLLRRPGKAGLASAYNEGFRRAIEGGYDLAVEMDSDMSHDPEELPGLLNAAQGLDLVIGSRYVPGGSVTNWSALRKGLSRAGNLYSRLLLGFPLTDSTSGFRVYRRSLLEALLAAGIHAEGYGFQIELAFRAWKLGYAVGESPITFKEREHGHSKISRRIVLEALWEVTGWGLAERFGRDAS